MRKNCNIEGGAGVRNIWNFTRRYDFNRLVATITTITATLRKR
jgi:hypothetical protein